MLLPRIFSPNVTSLLQGRHTFRRALAFTTMTLVSGVADAQTQTWIGPASGGTWQTPANWSSDTAPTSANITEFNSGTNTVTTGTTAAAAGALWDTGSVTGLTTLNGTGTLTLAGNLSVNGNANTAILLDDSGNFGLTIAAPLTLSNSTSFLVDNSATLTIQTGALSLGANTLTLDAANAAGAITISSAIGGTGGLIVNSAGTVSLNATNTFTGGLDVQAGTVSGNSAASFGATAGTITVGASSGSSSATVDETGTVTVANAITVAAGSSGVLTLEGSGASGNQIFSGAIALNNNLMVDNLTSGRTTTYSGTITAGSGLGLLTITKGTGAGTVLLDGQFVPNSSGIALANSGAGTLTITPSSQTISAAGTYYFQANSTGNIAFTGNVNTAATQVFTNNGTGTGTLTFTTGGPNGAGATFNEDSTTSEMILSSSNLYNTNVNVMAGFMQIGTGTGSQFYGSPIITISASGTLGLDINSGLNLGGTIADNGLLIANQSTGSANTISAVISGSGGVTQSGLGTLTLNATNSYSGVTTITSGMLAANIWGTGPDDSLGAYNATTGSTSSLVINGGTLGYENGNANYQTDRLFTLGANGATLDVSGTNSTQSLWFLNTGALAFSTPNVAETLTLTGTHGIYSHGTSLLFYDLFDPQITNNGSGATTLVKNGAGAWIVGGANNTYSGGTVVNTGTLQAQTPGSLGTGAITVAAGATVILNYDGTAYSTGAAEFANGEADNTPETDPTTLAYFIDNRMGGFAAGSTLGIDPSDLTGTSSTTSGTATVFYIGDSNGNLNTNGVNVARFSNTGNTANAANLVILANLDLVSSSGVSGGFGVYGSSGYTELEGNNTYTGATVLETGELVLGSNTALGNASGPGSSEISITGSSSLALDPSIYPSTVTSNAYVINTPVVFNAPVAGTTIVFTVGSGTAASANIDFNGSLTGSDPINGTPLVNIYTASGGTAQFSGPIYINDGLSSSPISIENFEPQAYGIGSELLISGNISDAPSGSIGGIGEMMDVGQASGIVDLTGNNTYTGPSGVFRGTLQVQTLGNYGTGTASSLGSPTTAAYGMIGLTTQGELSDIGTTNETSNRSIVMTMNGGTSGSFVLDYSGTGTLNIAGGIAPAFTPTAVTDTLQLQGSTTGKGIISGVVGTAPTAAFSVTNLAAVTLTTSATTTSTVILYVMDPMNLYFANGATITTMVNGVSVTGTVTAVGYDNITVTFPATGTAGTATFAANSQIEISGTGGLGSSGVTGTVGVTKTGTGTWELANTANTYNGVTTVTGGILQVNYLTTEGASGGTASSIGESSNAATNLVINGGTLQYIGSGDTTDRNFQIGQTSNGGSGTIDSSGTGALVLTGSPSWGTVNQTRTLILTGTNTNSNTISGSIIDDGTTSGAAAVTKNGVGTWVLSGASAYSGVTTINGGILSVSSIANGSTSVTISTTANTENATVSSATGLVVGQAIYDNPNIPNGTIITAISGTTITLSANATGTSTTAVTSLVGTPNSLGLGSASGSSLVINGGTLQYTGAAVTTNRGFTIGTATATVDASGTGAIDFTGTVIDTGGINRILTLTGTNTGANTLAAALVNPTAVNSLSIVKTGVGTWDLTGANTFTGSVAINSGVLGINTLNTLGKAQSLGEGTAAVDLGVANTSSGTLLYTGAAGTLTLGVTALGNGGDMIQNSGTGLLTISGTLTKNDTVLTLNGGSNGITVTGQITGGTVSNFNSDLDIVNGVTTLSNVNNNYTGPTNIYDGGTLKLGVANAVPTGSVLDLGNASDGAVTNTFDLDGFSQTVASLNSTNNTGDTDTNTITNSSTGTATATLTLSGVNSDSVASNGTYGGSITNGATAQTALSVTGGVQTLSGNSNTYSGGTSVTGSGTLLVNNTSGSATGTGAVSVGAGATIGGYGTSSGSGFSVSGTGTTTGTQANVLVGMNSLSDTNTTQILTMKGSTGLSTIANANLTFNLNAQLAGGLGGSSNGGSAGGLGVVGSGTELSVGNTNISFGTATGSVRLTLNLQNEPAIVPSNTPYVLFAGTGVTTDTGGVSGGQYTGLVLGTVTELGSGITETQITGLNLQLAFSGATDQSFYGASSYLVLFQDTETGTDDIDVEVIPEPGTWALMLGGLAMLIFWQRRKNKVE